MRTRQHKTLVLAGGITSLPAAIPADDGGKKSTKTKKKQVPRDLQSRIDLIRKQIALDKKKDRLAAKAKNKKMREARARRLRQMDIVLGKTSPTEEPAYSAVRKYAEALAKNVVTSKPKTKKTRKSKNVKRTGNVYKPYSEFVKNRERIKCGVENNEC